MTMFHADDMETWLISVHGIHDDLQPHTQETVNETPRNSFMRSFLFALCCASDSAGLSPTLCALQMYFTYLLKCIAL